MATVDEEPVALIKLAAPSLRSVVVIEKLPEVCTFPTATEPVEAEPGYACMLMSFAKDLRLTVGRYTFPPVLLAPLMEKEPEQLLHAIGFVVVSLTVKLTPAASVIAPPLFPPGVVASIRAALGAPVAVMFPLARATKSCPLVLKVEPLENSPL